MRTICVNAGLFDHPCLADMTDARRMKLLKVTLLLQENPEVGEGIRDLSLYRAIGCGPKTGAALVQRWHEDRIVRWQSRSEEGHILGLALAPWLRVEAAQTGAEGQERRISQQAIPGGVERRVGGLEARALSEREARSKFSQQVNGRLFGGNGAEVSAGDSGGDSGGEFDAARPNLGNLSIVDSRGESINQSIDQSIDDGFSFREIRSIDRLIMSRPEETPQVPEAVKKLLDSPMFREVREDKEAWTDAEQLECAMRIYKRQRKHPRFTCHVEYVRRTLASIREKEGSTQLAMTLLAVVEGGAVSAPASLRSADTSSPAVEPGPSVEELLDRLSQHDRMLVREEARSMLTPVLRDQMDTAAKKGKPPGAVVAASLEKYTRQVLARLAADGVIAAAVA